MLRWLLSGLFLVVFMPSLAFANDWQVDMEASALTFETTAFGGPVSGDISDFDAGIRLNPDDLGDAMIDARVGVASLDAGSAAYNDALSEPTGLAPEDHPDALFASEDIVEAMDCPGEDGIRCFVANGTLVIRGVAQPASLPFSLTISGGRGVANGTLNIARADFDIGASGWGDTASEVIVHLHIEAVAAD